MDSCRNLHGMSAYEGNGSESYFVSLVGRVFNHNRLYGMTEILKDKYGIKTEAAYKAEALKERNKDSFTREELREMRIDNGGFWDKSLNQVSPSKLLKDKGFPRYASNRKKVKRIK